MLTYEHNTSIMETINANILKALIFVLHIESSQVLSQTISITKVTTEGFVMEKYLAILARCTLQDPCTIIARNVQISC